MLADEFATFFTSKIDTLHNDLLVKKNALIDSAECVNDVVLTMSLTRFSTFTEVKLDDIRQLELAAVSWIHYHLLSSNNVRTYCCLLLLTSSTSLFVKAACLSV